MAEMCPALSQEFYHHLCEGGRVGKEDLLEFVRSAMFPGVVRYLFGPKNMSMSKVCEVGWGCGQGVWLHTDSRI